MTNENQEEGAWKDADIAKALSAHVRTAERTREKRVEMGVAIIPQEMCTALQLIRLPLILRN